MTPRRAVLLLYCACAVAAAFSLLGTVAKSGQLQGLVILTFCATAWVGINRLGYHEFGIAGKMLLNGAFQKRVRGELQLRRFREKLDASDEIEGFWIAVRDEAKSLGFRFVELRLGTQRFTERFEHSEASGPGWVLETPVNGGGQLRLERAYSATPLTAPIEALAQTLNRGVVVQSPEERRNGHSAAKIKLSKRAAGESSA